MTDAEFLANIDMQVRNQRKLVLNYEEALRLVALCKGKTRTLSPRYSESVDLRFPAAACDGDS